jgi:hypothetical protein
LRPFEPPPAEGAIPIEDLSPEEQAVVEAGLDEDYAAVHAAWSAATQKAAEDAAVAAAASDIGVPAIDGLGVMP